MNQQDFFLFQDALRRAKEEAGDDLVLLRQKAGQYIRAYFPEDKAKFFNEVVDLAYKNYGLEKTITPNLIQRIATYPARKLLQWQGYTEGETGAGILGMTRGLTEKITEPIGVLGGKIAKATDIYGHPTSTEEIGKTATKQMVKGILSGATLGLLQAPPTKEEEELTQQLEESGLAGKVLAGVPSAMEFLTGLKGATKLIPITHPFLKSTLGAALLSGLESKEDIVGAGKEALTSGAWYAGSLGLGRVAAGRIKTLQQALSKYPLLKKIGETETGAILSKIGATVSENLADTFGQAVGDMGEFIHRTYKQTGDLNQAIKMGVLQFPVFWIMETAFQIKDGIKDAKQRIKVHRELKRINNVLKQIEKGKEIKQLLSPTISEDTKNVIQQAENIIAKEVGDILDLSTIQTEPKIGKILIGEEPIKIEGERETLALPEEKVIEKQPKSEITKEISKNIKEGREDIVYMPTGEEIKVKYAVVPIEKLITSHTPEGYINKKYPAELQPRERSRVMSRMQIESMSKKLIPAWLGYSLKVDEGAPIVGEDLVVESGNGRTLALKLAYNTEKGKQYKDWLIKNAENFGLSKEEIQKIDKPILVRIRESDVDRINFTREANRETKLSMSSTEQAVVDSEKITNDMLSLLTFDEKGDLNISKNKDFIKKFVNLFSIEEQAKLLDKEGNLSQEGIRRIKNALFYKAYGDISTLERLSESLDDDIKNITKALLNNAPKVAYIRGQQSKGLLYNIDITTPLMNAVKIIEDVKDSEDPLTNILYQQTMFTDIYNNYSRAIAEFLYNNRRSAKKITDFISNLYEQILNLGNPKQKSLFGDIKEVGLDEIITTAKRIVEDKGKKLSGISPFIGVEPQSRSSEQITRNNEKGEEKLYASTIPINIEQIKQSLQSSLKDFQNHIKDFLGISDKELKRLLDEPEYQELFTPDVNIVSEVFSSLDWLARDWEKKFPDTINLAKNMIDLTHRRRSEAFKGIQYDLSRLAEAVKDLTPTDLSVVERVLVEEDKRNERFTEEQINRLLNENQQKYYYIVRQINDEILARQKGRLEAEIEEIKKKIAEIEAEGSTPVAYKELLRKLELIYENMGQIKAYIPRVRLGRYLVYFKKNGETFVIPFHTKSEALKLITKLKELRIDVLLKDKKKLKSQVEDFYMRTNEFEMLDFIHNALSNFTNLDENEIKNISKAIDELYKVRGFRERWMKRSEKLIHGYRTENLLPVFVHYYKGARFSEAKQKFVYDINKLMEMAQEYHRQRAIGDNIYRILLDTRDNLIRSQDDIDKVVNILYNIAFFRYIAGNIKTAVLNYISQITQAPPAMAYNLKIPISRALLSIAKAHYDLLTKNVSPEEKEMLKEIQPFLTGLTEYLTPEIEVDNPEVKKMLEIKLTDENEIKDFILRTRQILAMPFAITENDVRRALFLATYRQATKKGIDPQEAFNIAKDTVYMAHGQYERIADPMIFQRKNALLRIAKPLAFIFNKYTHNALNLYKKLYSEKAYKELGYLAGALSIFGGINAFIFPQILWGLYDWITRAIAKISKDTKPLFLQKVIADLRSEYPDIINGITKGLSYVAGVDLTQSLRLGIPYTLFTVPKRMLEDLYRAGGYIYRLKFGKAIESLPFYPLFAKRIGEAVSGYTSVRGRKVPLTTEERIIRALSGQPSRISAMYEKPYDEVRRFMIDWRQDIVDKVYSAGKITPEIRKEAIRYNREVRKLRRRYRKEILKRKDRYSFRILNLSTILKQLRTAS